MSDDPWAARADADRADWAAERKRERLLAAIEALPVHGISGYEWECGDCHHHWTDEKCLLTGIVATTSEEVDSHERPTDHQSLLDRDAVLALVRGD